MYKQTEIVHAIVLIKWIVHRHNYYYYAYEYSEVECIRFHACSKLMQGVNKHVIKHNNAYSMHVNDPVTRMYTSTLVLVHSTSTSHHT